MLSESQSQPWLYGEYEILLPQPRIPDLSVVQSVP
jgi:hypothetical protein